MVDCMLPSGWLLRLHFSGIGVATTSHRMAAASDMMAMLEGRMILASNLGML